MKTRISTKLMLAAGTVVLALVSALGITAYNIARHGLEKQIAAHLESVAQSRAAHVATFLHEHVEMIRLTATSRIMMEDLRSLYAARADKAPIVRSLNKRLHNLLDPDGGIYSVSLLDRHGVTVASTNVEHIGLDKSTDAYFVAGRNGPFIKDAYHSQTTGRDCLAFSAPLNDHTSGELLGVLVARLDIAALNEITTDRAGLGKTGETYLINKHGFMITQSRFLQDTFLKQKIDTENARRCLADMKAVHAHRLAEGHEHKAELFRDYRGAPVLGVHAHIPEMEWGLLAEIDASEAFAPVIRLRSTILALSLLAAGTTLGLACFFARRISRPIRELHVGSERIGRGELDYRVDIRTGDEIEELAAEFNRMAGKLSESHASLERKVAERTKNLAKTNEALRESRARYLNLIETVNDWIWEVDADGVYTYVSPKVRDMLGYEPEEVLGKTPFDLMAPEEVRRVGKIFGQIAARQEPFSAMENTNLHKDGHSVVIETSGVPFFDADGAFLGYRGVDRDITERKQAEEALRASNLYQRQLLDTAATGIFTVDDRRRITSINQAFRTMTGFRDEDVVGKCCEVLKGDICMKECPLFDPVRTEPILHKECTIQARDGRRMTILKNAGILRDNAGRVTGGVESFVDVTELIEAREAAETANRSKSEFLANMSHEIRTPMNGIIGMTEIALDTDLDPQQREYLETVKVSADSLLAVLNDILDFSKVEAGKLELDSVDFNLRDVVESTVRALAGRAHTKGLELACHVPADVHEVLTGDPGRLRQIIANLVGNAVKFTAEGEVAVHVETESETAEEVCLHFAVRDTGIGIPADKHDGIFDTFAQLDATTTRKYGGTGLGLAISSQLVEMLGGRIRVESPNPESQSRSAGGPGSIFHFTTRFRKQRVPAGKPVPAPPEKLRNMSVMVVDDNATNRRILTETLAAWAMRPRAFENGKSALAAMELASQSGSPFPLVLLDANMPDMDGFTVAERIKQHPDLAGATIMMLTSGGRRGDAARCRRLGVAAYLTKPITRSALLDGILSALGMQAAGHESKPLVTQHSLRETRRRLRILLAEDNAVNRKVITLVIGRWGHDVAHAENGKAVLATLNNGKPFDLILMDVQMPEMDGLEATAEIRKREQETGEHIPIVAMTAHALKGDRERCLAVGMDGYVSKPIRPEDMLDEIWRVVPSTAGNERTASAPQAEPAAAEPAVLDEAELLSRIGGNRDRMKEVVELFLEDCPKQMSDIREAIASSDSAGIDHAAHAFKGAVGNLGAHAAFQAAQVLEAAGQNGNLTGAQEAFAALEAEAARLRPALGRLTREDKP